MGNDTILYYLTEETLTGEKKSIKLHFWQKINLRSFRKEKDGLTVIAALVPNLSKGWKKEKLLRLMREAAAAYPEYAENAETVIHPDVWRMLTQPEQRKTALAASTETEAGYPPVWQNRFFPVFWRLAERILRERFPAGKGFAAAGGSSAGKENRLKNGSSAGKGNCLKNGSSLADRVCPDTVVLLLGDSFFPEEQMEQFLEMMSPYFPRLNHLTIFYVKEENASFGVKEENTGFRQENADSKRVESNGFGQERDAGSGHQADDGRSPAGKKL